MTNIITSRIVSGDLVRCTGLNHYGDFEPDYQIRNISQKSNPHLIGMRINEFVTLNKGDVFVYLGTRETREYGVGWRDLSKEEADEELANIPPRNAHLFLRFTEDGNAIFYSVIEDCSHFENLDFVLEMVENPGKM